MVNEAPVALDFTPGFPARRPNRLARPDETLSDIAHSLASLMPSRFDS
jgi:hypothetical protein